MQSMQPPICHGSHYERVSVHAHGVVVPFRLLQRHTEVRLSWQHTAYHNHVSVAWPPHAMSEEREKTLDDWERKLKDWEQLTVVCYCGERENAEQFTVVCYCGERERMLKDWEQFTVVCYCGEREKA